MKKTAQKILTEYGAIGVVVYFAIFFAVLFGFWAAIRAGWHPKGVGGGVGTFTAAYVATKLTQPLRIAATVALTPLVARFTRRGGAAASDAMPAESPSEETTSV